MKGRGASTEGRVRGLQEEGARRTNEGSLVCAVATTELSSGVRRAPIYRRSYVNE
ncbi:hypothetical protein P7K49_038356, partial [Saguinus oedipus]